jgi:polysaccharide biosynthesis transport protein
MNPKQILLIVFAHRYLAAIVFVVVALVGGVVTLKTPKSYMASTDLLVETRADPIGGAVTGNFSSYLETQVSILQSDRLAVGVVKRLRIAENPSLLEQWRIATQEKIPLENYFGDIVQRGLTVQPVRGTSIIKLVFEGADPKFVSTAANAYAQAYLDLTVDLRVEPIRQYAEWFGERQKALRADVETAQKKLSEYQRIKGIVDNDQRADVETQRLDALMTQLVAIQGENISLSSRQQTSGGTLSADTQASSVVQSLRAALNSAETKMSELRVTLGPNHPMRVQLEEQMVQLRQQLAQEMKVVAGSTSLAKTAGGLRERELRAAIAAQKERVIALRAERDEMAVLAQDVEAAKRIYDSVLQLGNQLDLEKQTDQANISILSPAVEPTRPAKPNTLKLLFMTFAAAFGAAFAAAGAVEFLNRKVRVIQDIMIEDIPVLGVIEHRREKYSARERLSLFAKFFTKRKLRKKAAASTRLAGLT